MLSQSQLLAAAPEMGVFILRYSDSRAVLEVSKATQVSTFPGQITETQVGLSAHGFIELVCHCRYWGNHSRERLGSQWDAEQEGPESVFNAYTAPYHR